MTTFHPIYTEKTECQDCYKCVRECPVKAIKIENGHAEVIADRCMLCGHCVTVCPRGAKKVRNDLGRAKQLLQRRSAVWVSLAPSYVTEFPGATPGQLISALMRLGFAGVSETALGAEEVSAHVADYLENHPGRCVISSACPTAVEYILKHFPQQAAGLTGLLSPVLAHCKLLRQNLGAEAGIVFISPCIAKKKEADRHPELLDVALTFAEIKEWLAENNLQPATEPDNPELSFLPRRAREGVLYPIDGGMIAGVQACQAQQARPPFYMSFSGISAINKALQDLDQVQGPNAVFMELLACEGGCVNGPLAGNKNATGVKRLTVYAQPGLSPIAPAAGMSLAIQESYTAEPVLRRHSADEDIKKVLKTFGKHTEKDEHNCGGCGYDACRELAAAVLEGQAEKTMCVSYMRKLAQKKANALLKSMPSGVVIVDEELRIVESNYHFAQLLGPEIEDLFARVEGLEHASLPKITPFSALFETALRTGQDVLVQDLRFKNTILHISIFTIEKHSLVGGIIQDITQPAVQKEQVIKKSQEVIQKNLETVQKIAYLLGENAAESEVLLDSIIKSFAPAVGECHES